MEAEVPLANGVMDTLSLVTASAYTPVFPIDQDITAIKKDVVLKKNIDAPVYKGTAYGKVVYTLEDKTLKEIDLIASETIEKKPPLIKRNKPFRYFVYFISAFILWKILVMYIRYKKRRRGGYIGGGRRRRGSSLQFSKKLRRR